jgi:hypothetical protein
MNLLNLNSHLGVHVIEGPWRSNQEKGKSLETGGLASCNENFVLVAFLAAERR